MKSAMPKRRLISLSLKTLFVLLTLTCLWLSWFVNGARRQQAAVKWVTNQGGEVEYDFQHAGQDPPGPDWLRGMVGIDYFSGVHSVRDSFRGFDTENLMPLADLNSLRELMLSRTPVEDLAPFARLTHLEGLVLFGVSVEDLSPLSELANLKNLCLRGSSLHDLDLSPLSGLTNLEVLAIDGQHDFSPLGQLRKLKTLGINESGPPTKEMQVSSISSLPRMPNLERLDLQRTHISDLTPLAQQTGLKSLWLSNTPDLSQLPSLPNLENLYLDNTEDSDLTPLVRLTRLKRLTLERTNVSDIEPLTKLTGLLHLELNRTGVSKAEYEFLREKLKNTRFTITWL